MARLSWFFFCFSAAFMATSYACQDKSSYCGIFKAAGYCSRNAKVMEIYCPKSCGKCATACQDISTYCSIFKAAGYCVGSHEKAMDIYCPKTCGKCDAVTPTLPPLPPLPGLPGLSALTATSYGTCQDKITYCPLLKSLGYCAGRNAQTMAIYCPKSCNKCASACQDKSTYCRLFKAYGYCSRNAQMMAIYCRKTCGKCGPVVPLPTLPPLPPVPTLTVAPGSCGKPEVAMSRIISGINANRGSWPWQILMLYNGRTMCGGSLVAPQWVVTAAHCVSGREANARNFKVRVGEHITSTTSDGQHTDMQVGKIISHPSYSSSTINNDIALMKLVSPVQFGKYVKPVCLPNQDQDVPVGTKCFISGWGKIQHPGNMHHTLQQAELPIISNENCTKLNTKNLKIAITDKMVCAGHSGATTVTGCHGDSGGPLVCQTGSGSSWVLHGAVSWGSGKCNARMANTVFARVSKFRSWIDQTMAGN